MPRGFVGHFYHAPDGVLECLDGLVVVDDDGIICDIVERKEEKFERTVEEMKQRDSLELQESGCCFLPGFVDLHVHAPQYPNMGTGLYLPLEEWLDKITFPLEASFEDPAKAREVYPKLIRDLLSNGTTCVLYFSSILACS